VDDYLPILTMIVLVVLFCSLSFTASMLLGPRRPTTAKQAPYECGIVPEFEPAERFPVKFYLVAMAFIVLDVEIIFLYPFMTILRDLVPGSFALISMGVFLLVLLVPFAYLLSTGALDWGPIKALGARAGQGVLRAGPGRGGLDPAHAGEGADKHAEEAA
jgi:NADH-quinone oxidoreductase subunit A